MGLNIHVLSLTATQLLSHSATHTFSFSYIPRCKSCTMNSWPKRSRCIQPLEYALQHSMQHTMLHTRSHFHISDVTVARWTPDLNAVGAFSPCPARTTNWAPRWSASLASLLLRCFLVHFFLALLTILLQDFDCCYTVLCDCVRYFCVCDFVRIICEICSVAL